MLRPPSPQLQQHICRWIDELPVDDWGQRWMKERRVCWLHANEAYNWYVDPDGTVWVEDNDRYGHRLESESCLCAAVNAVAQAARLRPELRGLLPERPEGAQDCPRCGTGGSLPADGRAVTSDICLCAGLGWVM